MTLKESVNSPISLFEEIFPGDTNPYGTAFGGRILALMDRAAGLAASRFAKCHFVTVSLDALQFVAPVEQGEIAEVQAQVVYTSRHTCGIFVQVFAIDKTQWDRCLCCRGSIFMVAKGREGKKVEIPQLEPHGQAEKTMWKEAHAIHQRMLTSKAKTQAGVCEERRT